MAGIKAVEFHVGGGKYEGQDDINWKYLNHFSSLQEACLDFDRYCKDYPVSELYVCIIYDDGNQERIDIEDGRRSKLVDGLWEPLS